MKSGIADGDADGSDPVFSVGVSVGVAVIDRASWARDFCVPPTGKRKDRREAVARVRLSRAHATGM